MTRFSTSLLFCMLALYLMPTSAGAQEVSDCVRNALSPGRCAAWQASTQTVSMRQIVELLDTNLDDLAKEGRISPEDAEAQRQRLAASQAAWSAYRDRQCALAGAHPEGPEMCRRLMAEARLAELQDPDLPDPGLSGKSWSERRLLQGDRQIEAWTMLRVYGPPMRTVADRVALARGPRETQDWGFRKEVSNLQQKIREVSRFGPLTSGFIAAEWDALRYDPETGARLHQFPERVEGSPADSAWDRDEAGAFAARLPACLRNMAEPKCRVQYSTELGCRYEPDMASFCQTKLDSLKETFQSFSITEPNQRDDFYQAVACLTPAPFDERFSGSFLESGSIQGAGVKASSFEGRQCSELGLAKDGNGWFAPAVPVFGVTMDMQIR